MDKEELILEWFYNKYDTPENLLPWVEGEFIELYGTVESSEDIIMDNFSIEEFDKETIDNVINDLDIESEYWSPIPDEKWYEDSLYLDFTYIDDIYKEFDDNLELLSELITCKLSHTYPDVDSLELRYNQLMFANVYTGIETLLADIVIHAIKNDEDKKLKFITLYKGFNDKKGTFSSHYLLFRKLEDTIKEEVNKITWHNFKVVKELYKSIFDLDIDFNTISKSLYIRHDIVHRNGKDKDGKKHYLGGVAVLDLIKDVREIKKYLQKNIKIDRPDF